MIGGKVSRDALSDRAYEMLRAQIIDHRLAPGQRLTMERLSALLDVSHTPIREALNRLVTERLVSVEPYKGFRVTDLLDENELRQLFDARSVIEQGALRTAVDHLDDETVDELRQIVEKLDGVAGRRSWTSRRSTSWTRSSTGPPSPRAGTSSCSTRSTT